MSANVASTRPTLSAVLVVALVLHLITARSFPALPITSLDAPSLSHKNGAVNRGDCTPRSSTPGYPTLIAWHCTQALEKFLRLHPADTYTFTHDATKLPSPHYLVVPTIKTHLECLVGVDLDTEGSKQEPIGEPGNDAKYDTDCTIQMQDLKEAGDDLIKYCTSNVRVNGGTTYLLGEVPDQSGASCVVGLVIRVHLRGGQGDLSSLKGDEQDRNPWQLKYHPVQ